MTKAGLIHSVWIPNQNCAVALHGDVPQCSKNMAFCPQEDQKVHPHHSSAKALAIIPSFLPRRESTKINKQANTLYALRTQISGHALLGLWMTHAVFIGLSKTLALFRHLALIVPPSSLYPSVRTVSFSLI